MMSNLKRSSLSYFLCGLTFCLSSSFFIGEARAFAETKIGTATASSSLTVDKSQGCILNGVPISCDISAGSIYSAGYNTCSLTCNYHNTYAYDFNYEISQDGEWKQLPSRQANKCDQIKLKFNPRAEGFASLTRSCQTGEAFIPCNPADKMGAWGCFNDGYAFPTDFLPCQDQTSCLNQATEHSLSADTFGKGVQKIPVDFAAQTEKSLNSSNGYMKCTEGVCTSYASGDFPLSATVPASSYLGQCRGFGAIIDTPETAIPAVIDSTTVKIINLPPSPAVSFEENQASINEEVNVTCDIVDSDQCSDQIAKVKWTCTDSDGRSDNCYFWREEIVNWDRGSVKQNLASSERSNPYRAIAKFKATQGGNYAVTCEATDDDASNPLSGTGIAGVQVVGKCGKDGICNSDCNPADPDCSNCEADEVCVQGCSSADPDCGEIAIHNTYCALLAKEGGSSINICNEAGEAKYEAYSSGIDPVTYKWKCSTENNVQESSNPETTCAYNNAGSFLPSLSIVDKNGKETQCVTQTETTVNKGSSCKIQVRKAGSTEDFKDTDSIDITNQVEAVISKRCLAGGAVKWEIPNGTLVNQTKDIARIKFNAAGAGQIKARFITNDGQTIDCGEAGIDIKEKTKFGT